MSRGAEGATTIETRGPDRRANGDAPLAEVLIRSEDTP